jgi:hypothetical protein
MYEEFHFSYDITEFEVNLELIAVVSCGIL